MVVFWLASVCRLRGLLFGVVCVLFMWACWCWFGFYALVYRFAGVGFRLVLVVLWMVLQYALLVTLGFACGG